MGVEGRVLKLEIVDFGFLELYRVYYNTSTKNLHFKKICKDDYFDLCYENVLLFFDCNKILSLNF